MGQTVREVYPLPRTGLMEALVAGENRGLFIPTVLRGALTVPVGYIGKATLRVAEGGFIVVSDIRIEADAHPPNLFVTQTLDNAPDNYTDLPLSEDLEFNVAFVPPLTTRAVWLITNGSSEDVTVTIVLHAAGVRSGFFNTSLAPIIDRQFVTIRRQSATLGRG